MESANISISILDEGDITQLSTVLQQNEILSIIYSCNTSQRIDPVTLQKTNYSVVSLTCNGSEIDNETGAKLLGLFKRFMEFPETLFL